MAYIFISYSTKNSSYANQLAEQLRTQGFDVWIDNAKLRSGDNWWESIVKALRGCSAFVVVMSPEARESKWVQRETVLADNWNKPTFPVLLAGEGDDWELYVLTQYEDVRQQTVPDGQHQGKLPSADFYERLSKHVTRKNKQKGDFVTLSAPQTQAADDSEVRAALANAPAPEKPSPAEQPISAAKLHDDKNWDDTNPIKLTPAVSPERRKLQEATAKPTPAVSPDPINSLSSVSKTAPPARWEDTSPIPAVLKPESSANAPAPTPTYPAANPKKQGLRFVMLGAGMVIALLVFVLLVLNGNNANAAPKADFSWTSNGRVVQFQWLATGNVTNYEWQFANGQKAFTKDPQVTFNAWGDHEVTLLVWNDSQQDSKTQTVRLSP